MKKQNYQRWRQNESNEQWKKAAALQYDPRVTQAPVLTAKGRGEAAQQILQLAREHDIPIQEDPALMELLTKIDLRQQIPPELYEVVAEILALVYNLEKRAQHHE